MYKFIILIIFIPIGNLFSQNDSPTINMNVVVDTTYNFKLNNFEKPFSINFSVISITKKQNSPFTIFVSKIYDGAGNFVQTIKDTSLWLDESDRNRSGRFSGEVAKDISFFDINFDGNTDLRIKNQTDFNGQSNFRYYLFSAEQKKFIYSKTFSELCCNLSINSNLKEIYLEDYNINEETSTKWTYKVINNEPILNEIKIERVYTEDNKQKFRTIISKLLNGKMKVVKDTVVWKGM